MQRSTEIAMAILRGKPTSDMKIPNGLKLSPGDKPVQIAEIMDYQHALLRDYYDVSTPEIEGIREAMKEAGCLGVKISGSGMGGAIIGLIRHPENGKDVIREALHAGAARGWVSPVAGGELSRRQ